MKSKKFVLVLKRTPFEHINTVCDIPIHLQVSLCVDIINSLIHFLSTCIQYLKSYFTKHVSQQREQLRQVLHFIK